MNQSGFEWKVWFKINPSSKGLDYSKWQQKMSQKSIDGYLHRLNLTIKNQISILIVNWKLIKMITDSIQFLHILIQTRSNCKLKVILSFLDCLISGEQNLSKFTELYHWMFCFHWILLDELIYLVIYIIFTHYNHWSY